MTVQEYHKLPHISASKLKVFLSDRHKFKKHVIDGVPEKKKKHTGSTLLGDLTDFFLLRDVETGGVEHFDDVYSLYKGTLPPPQFREFADELYENTLEAQDDVGKQSKTFEELLKETFDSFCFDGEGNRVKFKAKRYAKYENFLLDFTEKTLDYYRALRDTTDKDIVTLSDIETAKKVVKKAQESWVTRKFFDLRSGTRYKILKQLAIIYQFGDETLKGLLDYVIIDTLNKVISPFDLKTLYRQAEFENNYLKYGYWLATALYTTGLKVWAEKEGYVGYKIKPLGFLRVSTNFTESPLITLTTDEQYVKCCEGFDIGKRHYKGLTEALDEIAYHKKYGFWDMSVDEHKKNGVTIIDFI